MVIFFGKIQIFIRCIFIFPRHPFISKEERDLIEVSLGKRPVLPSLNRSISATESIRSELDGSDIGHDDKGGLF